MPPAQKNHKTTKRSIFWSACFWVPTLYFAQGLPNTLVDQIAPVFLKDLKLDNALIITIGAWAYLPWTLKALWSPLVDGVGEKRTWIFLMQLLIALALAVLALGIVFCAGTPAFPWIATGTLALIAAASATHDIAADGFYMLALSSGDQALYSGFRSTFFRLAVIFGKGGIIALAGTLIISGGNAPDMAWTKIILGLAALLALLAATHFFILPHPKTDVPAARDGKMLKNFIDTWCTFFQKKGILTLLFFLFFYRLGEVQIGAVSSLFFKDDLALGGLAIDNVRLGLLSGTIGTIALLAGGILAGVLVAWRGLKFWFLPMLILLNFPNLIYVAFAHWQPSNLSLLGGGIAIEQFGYGFGFTGYMLYMLYACNTGTHRVAHYAICTGLMALGAMLPKFWTGTILDALGYENFFWCAILCTLPGFFAVALISKNLDPAFGKK